MKYIFLLFLLAHSLFAVSVDKSWYENTNEELQKKYEEQKQRISSTAQTLSVEEKEQIDYQKILLNKLSKNLNKTSEINFPKNIEIKTINNFIDTVKKYLQINENYLNIQASLKENESKIQTLEDQINKSSNKDEITTINSQLLFALYTIENRQNKQTLEIVNKILNDYKQGLLKSLNETNFAIDSKNEEQITKLTAQLEQLNKDEKNHRYLWIKQ